MNIDRIDLLLLYPSIIFHRIGFKQNGGDSLEQLELIKVFYCKS
jgi:hypothetical protein